MSLKTQLLALVATLPAGIGLKEVGNAALDAAEKEIIAKLCEKMPQLTAVEVQVDQYMNDDQELFVDSIDLIFADGRISLVGDELQGILENKHICEAFAARLDALEPADKVVDLYSDIPKGLEEAIEQVHSLLYDLPRVRDLPLGRRRFDIEAGVVAQWNARLPVPDGRFPNLALRNTYVYYSAFEEEHSFDRAAYWNNSDGWTTLEGADLFDADESCHARGPFDPKGEVKATRLLFHVLPDLRESIRQINTMDHGEKPGDAKWLELEGITFRNGDWVIDSTDPMAYGLFVVFTDGTKKLGRIWEEYAVAYPHAYSMGQDLGLQIGKAEGNRDTSYLSFRAQERKKTAAEAA